MTSRRTTLLLTTVALAGFSFAARAQQDAAKADPKAEPKKADAKPKLGYDDTPMQPYGTYRVHDGTRPQPTVVTPGTASTQDAAGKAPSDAIVLFDGKDPSEWKGNVKVVDGALVLKKGGGLATRKEFGDCQLHIEWATPTPPTGRDQSRGNSGVMMFGRYEIQVLDNYNAQTYPDGQAGAIYGQYPPLVNACRPAGEWQTYDLVFNAPKFKADGAVETPAYVTLIHNGVLVQNHEALLGAVAFRALAKYEAHGPKGPIVLQDHGSPVRFRNIWVRELKGHDQP